MLRLVWARRCFRPLAIYEFAKCCAEVGPTDGDVSVDAKSQRSMIWTHTAASSGEVELAEDQVALGDYSPRAPTGPYVPALEHTVPQIMVSLREVEAWNELRVRERADNDGVMHRISASASSGCCCGG